MSDIFISYAREDEVTARALAQFFQQQGCSVWWDRKIPPGRRYSDVIGEAMHDAKVMIVLWSKHSISSDWVKDEAQEGLNRGILIPVLIEEVSLPLGFRQLHAANLINWDRSSLLELEELSSEVTQLIGPPGLKLKLKDVDGSNLNEIVDLTFLPRTPPNASSDYKGQDASRDITIPGLRTQETYQVTVNPTSYFPVTRLVNVNASGTTEMHITLCIKPDKVQAIDFPRYEMLPRDLQKLMESSSGVVGFAGKSGKDLYGALDDIRRANLLNTIAKLQTQTLANSKNVLSYLRELKELRGDSVLVFVDEELRKAAQDSVPSDRFRMVNSSLHHLPQQFKDFQNAGAFKTEDKYGALQLTFFMQGDNSIAFIDLDENGGLEHIFQIPSSSISIARSHPYYFHEILIAYQKIDPGYRLAP